MTMPGRSAPALALALMLGAAAPLAAAPRPLTTARALAVAMAGGRSAEAAVSYDLPDPMGRVARAVHGRVRVESPDRVRLDFMPGGEKIALRSDGGEWLQPASKQLIRIPPERAAAALQWWRVLLPESRETFREDSLAPRRFRLEPLASAGPSLRITARLDARGFPSALVVEGLGDSAVTYRLSGWKFGPARGESAYRLTAPPGYESVELP